MNDHHTLLGILALALTLVLLGAKYFRISNRRALPRRGWLGLAIILCAETLVALHWNGLFPWDGPAIFLTPVVWSGFLLLIDGLVWTLGGISLMAPSPRRFWRLATWSLPLWMIFEAYNLRLENWTYVGLPTNPWVSELGRQLAAVLQLLISQRRMQKRMIDHPGELVVGIVHELKSSLVGVQTLAEKRSQNIPGYF